MTARTPRRLRPSVERRGDVSVDTHTALSAKGEVRSAAPVTEGGRKATIYVPPVAVGPISSALFKDPGTPSFGSAYEPSVLVDSFGDASCFHYNGSADIEFLVDGWYQFNVSATVAGAGDGDVLHIEGDAGWDGTSVGYGVATSGAFVFLTASSIPFHSLADDGNSIDARVYNHSSTSGTISQASIYVVRLA